MMKIDKSHCSYDILMAIFFLAGAIATSSATVFGSRVRFTCPEGQVFATGVEVIDTTCLPGGEWSQSYIPKCQEVWIWNQRLNSKELNNYDYCGQFVISAMHPIFLIEYMTQKRNILLKKSCNQTCVWGLLIPKSQHSM